MTSITTNIKVLAGTRHESYILRGKQLAELPFINNAYLIIEDGDIAEFGEMDDLLHHARSFAESYDASGQTLLPAWCDSHTHLVHTGSREDEFVYKLQGLTYAEIAEKGGGILNSANRLNAVSEDALFNESFKRLEEVSKLGTGAIEIKSGYGLCVEGELKMLRVIKRLKEQSNVIIKSTFLGAHAFPLEFKDDHQAYIDQIVYQMLPVIAEEKLADFIDVFCEEGFFNPAETELICKAGIDYGLKPKLHVNQLNSIGAIEAGMNVDALSLDHLETLTDNEMKLLAGDKWSGLCTLLPTAAFFLRMPFQQARTLIDNGAAVALASDYNPGSSPSGNMNFVVALSSIQMKMLPEEAINAATINGAYAMGIGSEAGSITKGKKANVILTKPINSLAYLPYSFATNLIDKVMIKGEWLT